MRWLKGNLWKMGVAIAGMLLLLVLMVGVPVSTAGAYERASGLVTPGTGTVQATPTAQATPTIDPTIVAATAQEQLRKLERDNDRSFQAWFWNASATLGTTIAALAVVVVGIFGLIQWRGNRNDERRKEAEAQDKDLKDKAEERFKTTVTALGDEKEGVQVGGAILLRSFLNKDDKEIYGRYYTQIFDLAVAYLRFPRAAHPPEDPDGPSSLPEQSDVPQLLTPLSHALIMVFKEAFSLARDRLKEQNPKTQFLPQSLDATDVQLDNAYLVEAVLTELWMHQASLREADLSRANLSRADLRKANLREANLREANLSGANLYMANLSKANLIRADLIGADLREANLSRADLSEATIEGALTLESTNLRGVKGLTKEKLAICKTKGAIIDEDTW